MANPPPLKIRRNQLDSFIKDDFEAIRQFELLFSTTLSLNEQIKEMGNYVYGLVGNTTGSTIPKGSVVGFAGAASDAILVSPYLADGSLPSLYIFGVMPEDLPDSGQRGRCVTWGFVPGIDTSAFSVGDILYASPTVAGGFTNVKPTSPDNVIPVAACLISDASDGVIFVRPSIDQMQYYGIVSKTTTQSPALINTEYLLTFDNVDISNGVTIGTPSSRIVAPESGFYQLDATVQVQSTNASQKNIWVWFKKNGVNIANSARIVSSIVNNGFTPIALSETVSLNAGDYIEMAFASSHIAASIKTEPSTAFAPAAPAIVLAMTQVQQ